MKEKCADFLPPEERARLASQLKRHEGLRLSAYLDGEGVLSIGYGHNCAACSVSGVSKIGDFIAEELAEELFMRDLALAEAQIYRALPWLASLADPRQAVLINMAFNMGLGSAASGRGLLSFRHMLTALHSGNFIGAAREMLKSRWSGSSRAQGEGTGRADGKRAVAKILVRG